MKSRLGTGKSLTFFYSVGSRVFQAEKSPFQPIAAFRAILEHLYSEMADEPPFIEFHTTVHTFSASFRFQFHCQWADVFTRSESHLFTWPLFKNSGETPAFRKGGFSATFSPIFKESAFGQLYRYRKVQWRECFIPIEHSRGSTGDALHGQQLCNREGCVPCRMEYTL